MKTFTRKILIISLTFLIIASQACGALALSSGGTDFSMKDYAATVFDPSTGMPFSEANVTVQTPDGFIYIGSYGGLTRYDGRTFERIEGVSSAVALYPDSRGRLWIGTSEMGAACLEYGQLTVYGTAEGLPSLAVRGFYEEPDGSILMAMRAGLARLDAEGRISEINEEHLRGQYISMVSGDSQGRVYVLTQSGYLVTLSGGEPEYAIPVSEFGADMEVVYADPDRPGWIYLGTEGREVLYGCVDDAPSSFERLDTGRISGVNWLLKDSDRLWVCAGDGAGYFGADGRFTELRSTPVANAFEHVMIDREGSLWFSSSRRGVMKLSRSMFIDVSAQAGLEARVVNSVLYKDGLLYAGTDSGLVVLDSDYESVETPLSEILSDARIRSIRADKNGYLWFSTYSSSGLVRYDTRTQDIRCFNSSSGLDSDYVRDALPLSDGSVLVSVSGGFCRLRGDSVVRSYDSQLGDGENTVLCMSEAADGKVYLGCDGGGIYVYENGAISPFEDSGKLSDGTVICLAEDSANGCVWVITGKYEFACIRDGSLTVFEDLPAAMRSSNPIYSLFAEKNGACWLLGGSGVCRFDGGALIAGSDPSARFFSINNGLAHVSTVHSRNFVSDDGIAYLAGSDGITAIELEKEKVSQGDPILSIPYVEIDGERIWLKDGTVTLNKGAHRIVIHPAVLSYTLDDPELTWQLEGFDRSQSSSRVSGLPTLSYTNLPGRDYTFRMTVSGEGGTKETVLAVTQEKRWYEHTLTHVVFAAGFLAIAVLTVSFILRRQKDALERKNEEARINNELSLAANIQADMLPSEFPERGDIGLYASMKPAKEVGGDFYDFFMTDDDHIALVVADVSGKGVPAALFMTLSKTLIKSRVLAGPDPAKVLWDVNAKLCENNEKNMFVTVWLGILELSTGRLTWADAGHEKPAVFSGGSWSLEEKHNGVALGLIEPELLELDDDPPFVDQTLQLHHGDMLLQYTDGVPEAMDAEETLFGEERLLDSLKLCGKTEPEAAVGHVNSSVNAFVKDAPQFDDITMLCIEYK